MDTDIRDALVEGVYEVYSILFTDSIQYCAFAPGQSGGLYGEISQKSYSPAVSLVGKVVKEEARQEDISVYTNTNTIKFTIPKKSFDLAGVSLTDISVLKRGVFKYKNVTYNVIEVGYGENIVDTFLTYSFICQEEK